MVRMPAGLGTGLVGGCGVGTAPDTGSGAAEPPPSPQAVKTATVASTRGREITGTPKLSGTPSLGLSRELAHAIHRHATCPLPTMGTTGTFRPLLGVSTWASQRMVPGMVRRWELEGDKYARMIQLVQRQLKRGWSTGSFFKVILVFHRANGPSQRPVVWPCTSADRYFPLLEILFSLQIGTLFPPKIY